MRNPKPKSDLTSRDLQAIERKQQLLNSAKELFASQGYHATTTRAITKHIGMADGLIYHYFPEGKQQILDSILREFLEERYQRIESDMAVLKEATTIRELLMSLGQIFFTYIANDKQVLLILLKEKSAFSEEHTESFNHHANLLIRQTMELIQIYVDRQEIRGFDIFMMVNQFWSAIYSYIIQEVFFDNHNMYQSDKATYLRQVVDYTLLTWKI